MAYKFQLGAFTASGSITSSDDIDAQGNLTGSGIALTDASGIAGNVLADNNGALDLNIAVSGGLEAFSNEVQIKVATVAGLETDENGLKLRLGPNAGLQISGSGPGELNLKISGSDNGLNLNGDGLAIKLSGSGGLGVDGNGAFIALPSGAGLELEPGGLKIETGGVTNDMLSGSIDNAKLLNNNITVGTTAIALGASSTTLAGMTGIDFAAGNASIAANIGANTLTVGGSTSTVRIAGDLEVVGTLERVTETELLIEDKVVIVASGSANAAGAAGSGLKVDIATGDMTFLYQANGENVGGVDASASGDIFVASGSAGLIDIQAASFYGDGSQLTGITADSVTLTPVSKTDTDTLEANKVNYFGDNSNATWNVNLPASPDAGDYIYIKAADITGNGQIIINRAGSQTIDGETSITLESPYAAVTLIYVASNDWRVF